MKARPCSSSGSDLEIDHATDTVYSLDCTEEVDALPKSISSSMSITLAFTTTAYQVGLFGSHAGHASKHLTCGGNLTFPISSPSSSKDLS